MPTVNWDFKNEGLQAVIEGFFRASTIPTNFYLALLNNASANITNNSATILADEISGNGYTRNQITFAASTVNSNIANTTGTSAIITASGGSIVYTHGAIIDNSNNVIAMCDFGGSQTIVDGSTHQITTSLNLGG